MRGPPPTTHTESSTHLRPRALAQSWQGSRLTLLLGVGWPAFAIGWPLCGVHSP